MESPWSNNTGGVTAPVKYLDKIAKNIVTTPNEVLRRNGHVVTTPEE